MNIFSLWKQLPDLDIVDKANKIVDEQKLKEPILDIEDIKGVEEIPEADKGLWHNWIQCDGCKRYWRGEDLLAYHKRKSTKYEWSSSMPKVE